MRPRLVLALVLGLVGTSRAHAQTRDRDDTPWIPRRQLHVGTTDLVVSGAAGAVALGAAIAQPLPNHWYGGALFDEDARDALRLHSLDARYMARDASDVGISFEVTWPYFIDALVTAWWYRGNAKLARDMVVVSAETMTLTAAAQGMTNTLASRERPYGRTCGAELPGNSADCVDPIRYRSFFSGHSAMSFASAGTICVHHLGLGLLGQPWDTVTCATGLTVATANALFRVMSDMHYASDVMVGALVGGTIGFLVPSLHLSSESTTTAGRVEVRVAPVGQGIGLAGSF